MYTQECDYFFYKKKEKHQKRERDLREPASPEGSYGMESARPVYRINNPQVIIK